MSSYKSRRRPWVKLYCRDWLTGTVRFQLTRGDRSVFVDALAMAGDSRFPGTVAAGYEGAKGSHLMGYPLNWLAAQMSCSEDELRSSLAKLEVQERIRVEQYKETVIIHILGWTTYQSEYLRQIERFGGNVTSGGSSQKLRTKRGGSSQKLLLEVEGDVDIEAEGEKPKPSASRSFELPEWVPKESWEGFLEMRSKKKRPPPNTTRAQRLLLTQLTKLRDQGNDPIRVLDRSTENGWAGLFELKEVVNRERRSTFKERLARATGENS